MKLLKLQIENFRNHQTLDLDFSESDSFIFVGKNGLGKTNIIEAIHLASLARSFRTNNLNDLIQWEKDYFRVTLHLSEELALEVFTAARPARQKSYRLNGLSVRASNYIGNFPTVLFQPQDLNLISLSPQIRRDYLDILLCQTDRDYITALSKYKKILKQRNALLKTMKARFADGGPLEELKSELLIWDAQIADHGSLIIVKRQQLVEFLNLSLTEFYRELSAGNETIKVEYHCTITANYSQILLDRQQIDIFQGLTTKGPHRDDLAFLLNDKPMTAAASRGEFRTLLLALKLAEIAYIKEKTAKKPVLLLDDVFSELDPERRKKLLRKIQTCQSIITTTDLDPSETTLCKNVKICYNIGS